MYPSVSAKIDQEMQVKRCSKLNQSSDKKKTSELPRHFIQTWIWLRVESWVDSEANAFRLSHELIWIEKWRITLSHEPIWINAWGIHLSHEMILSQFLESRLSHKLNRLKSSWSCLSDELLRIKALSWMLKKGQRNWVQTQKRSTKLSENPKRSTKSAVDSNQWPRFHGHL